MTATASVTAPAAVPVREYDPPLQSCPLCAGRLRPFDVDLHRDNRIERCGDCRVRLVNPQYADRWLAQFYAGYIAPAEAPAAELPRRKRPQVRSAGKRRALQLLARYVGRGRILMVGCGDGLELQVAAELGWQPEGYDVDPATTRTTAERLGLPVHCGPLPMLLQRGQRYDAVFLDQVIEHPKDPAAWLRAAHLLLRPGGAMFLATPNAESLSNRGKTLLGRLGLRGRRRGRHYDSNHHLFGFSPRVLRRLLPAFGFEVLTLRAWLKPHGNLLARWLGRWLPVLDSNLALVARRA